LRKLYIRKDKVKALAFQQIKSFGSRNSRLDFITLFSEDYGEKVKNTLLVFDNKYLFRFGLSP